MNKAAKIALRSDPITNEVVRNAYNAIANDMSAVVSRSAYSPIIYEAHDFGIAIFDAKARLLGQYAGLPLFTGGLDAGLREVIRKYGYENLKAGDVYTINDSWIADDRRKLLAFARDLLNSDYAGHRLTFQLFAQSPPFAHLAAVYRNFDWDGPLDMVQKAAGLSNRVRD